MHPLSRQKCFNHAKREAAALCLDCKQFFCRECITEHDGRVICANCLLKIQSHAPAPKKNAVLIRLALFLSAMLFLWFLFYSSGQVLLKLPDTFHEGTLWKELWQKL